MQQFDPSKVFLSDAKTMKHKFAFGLENIFCLNIEKSQLGHGLYFDLIGWVDVGRIFQRLVATMALWYKTLSIFIDLQRVKN